MHEFISQLPEGYDTVVGEREQDCQGTKRALLLPGPISDRRF